MTIVCTLILTAALTLIPSALVAQVAPPPTVAPAQPSQQGPARSVGPSNGLLEDETVDAPTSEVQIEQLAHAIARLPLAAALASVLALRPQRRGTPKRKVPVIQTQIILAVVGAVVMLVVGSSLARAFGIVGAAGLVRYRAKISDPKDAGVMLSTLSIGLACGVGIWMIATFATVFILGVLWIIESFEPKVRQEFLLTVKSKDPATLRPKLEELLARSRLEFELRSTKEDELSYEVRKPLEKKTDRLSEVILKLAPDKITGVEWEEKEDKT